MLDDGVNLASQQLVFHLIRIIAVGAFAIGELQASTWRIEHGIAVDLNGSEQVREISNESESSTLVRLSPYVDLSGRGKSSSLEFRASANVRHQLDNDLTETGATFIFGSNTQVISRVLSVSTAAALSERIIDVDAVIDDSISGVGNRARVREFSITPLLNIPLGSDATVQTSFRAAKSEATTSGDDIGSRSTELISELRHATQQGLISSVRVGLLSAEFDNSEKSETSSVTGALSFPFSRTLSFNVAGGYETLRFDSGDIDEDGKLWRLGLNWTPLERISVDVGYGRRLFGRTPSIAVGFEGKRSLFRVSLSRDLAFEQSSAESFIPSDQNPTTISDEPTVGEPTIDIGGADGTLSPIARDARAIDERAVISYTLFGRRSELTGLVSWYERSQIDVADTIDSVTAEVTFLRRLSEKTDLVFLLSERRTESDNSDETEFSRTRRVGIVLNYVL